MQGQQELRHCAGNPRADAFRLGHILARSLVELFLQDSSGEPAICSEFWRGQIFAAASPKSRNQCSPNIKSPFFNTIGHLRRFGDVGGMSLFAPNSNRIAHSGNRR
jgi:hypothetical protein